MRIAEWAKKQGFKIAYYISPQVWAWKEKRVEKIKRDVDRMLVILPFETDFYRKWNYDVTYVGHPLVEVVEHELKAPTRNISAKPIIALLPGSRKQEIKVKLPIMLQVVDRFPQYQFVVAQAPSLPADFYMEIIGDKNVLPVKDQTYNVLKQASAALVTSGTATLETALFGVPEVVCYKGNPISYWLATKLIKVKYISLVNLIMDKPVVTELIQADLNVDNLETELKKILNDGPHRQQLLQDYKQLWHRLGHKNASALAAAEVIFLAHN
jgi:lipid-A-disaccharide synthase